ncbi:hypothetical protein L4C36_21230 [Photobacterium japonica]|uniref:hypothetical protein n=1 Tax=Photobacterium japonica TaxID=2910235 RepID=UPI003D0FD594
MAYAPEFTRRDKFIRLGLMAAAMIATYFFFEYRVFPFVEALASQPYCYEYWGMNGAEFLFMWILSAFPLAMSAILFVMLFPIGNRSWQEGQYPPSTMKVYKPTVIQHGFIARVRAGACMVIPILFLLVGIAGTVEWQSYSFEKADVATAEETASCPT